MPIDVTAIVAIVMGSLMVLIPVAGFTARYAMKPIVDSLARLRESGAKGEALDMLERRLTLLEQEVQSVAGIRDDLARLVEEMEFQRKLSAPGSKPGKE